MPAIVSVATTNPQVCAAIIMGSQAMAATTVAMRPKRRPDQTSGEEEVVVIPFLESVSTV
ncbi:MAG: hypothetical protein ACREMS_02400 [Gemmatimonadaceae bacterium]